MMFKGKQECRPSMVVLVNDVEKTKALIQKLASKVIEVINRQEKEKFSSEEDPFWLQLVFHKPEFFSEMEPLMNNGESDEQRLFDTPRFQAKHNDPNSIFPGDQIETDNVFGTVGLFLYVITTLGEKKHFGITCSHLPFRKEKCSRKGCVTESVFSSCKQLLCLSTEANRDDYGRTLYGISSSSKPHKVQSILSEHKVVHHRTGKQIGSFYNILYGFLHDDDQITICSKCNQVKDSKSELLHTDLAIFCIDNESEIECSLKNLSVDKNEITWSVWSPDTSLSITKIFMGDPIVYTYNVREHSIHSDNSFTDFEEAKHKACTRKATVQSVGCTTMNIKHKSKTMPHLILRTHDDTNKRLFADRGDSGSLLYKKVNNSENLVLGMLSSTRNRHYHCKHCNGAFEQKPDCTYSPHTECGNNDCSKNILGCRCPTLAYGFFLQPALDTIMSQILLADHEAKRSCPEQSVIENAPIEDLIRQFETRKEMFDIAHQFRKREQFDTARLSECLKSFYHPCTSSNHNTENLQTPASSIPDPENSHTSASSKPNHESSETPASSNPNLESSETSASSNPNHKSSETPASSNPNHQSSETPASSNPNHKSSETPASSNPDHQSSETPASSNPDHQSSETPASSNPDHKSSETPASSNPNHQSSETPASSNPDHKSSETPASSNPNHESSQMPASSIPDHEDSQMPASSKPNQESSETPASSNPNPETPVRSKLSTAKDSQTPDKVSSQCFYRFYLYRCACNTISVHETS